MKRYTVAVVGLGYWGPNLVRNFQQSSGFKMKWACDLIDDNLKKVSREYPHIQVTKNISFVLEDPEVDLIAIATQPETHFRLGNLVLDAGKHLWIEKPFTTSLGEAKKLLEKAKQRKKYLHVDLPFIFYGPVVKIKELLEKRVIGNRRARI